MQELEKNIYKNWAGVFDVSSHIMPDKNQECYSNILYLESVKLIVSLAAMSNQWYLSGIN